MTTAMDLSNALAGAVERAAGFVLSVHGRPRLPSTGVQWRAGLIVTALLTVYFAASFLVCRPMRRMAQEMNRICAGNDAEMLPEAYRSDELGLAAAAFNHVVCDLQWTQVDFAAATLAVTRAKHGTPSTHPLTGRELRALRRLHRDAEGQSPFLFVSERGSPMTVSNFQKSISRACEAAGLKIKAHPHMLRHACGFHQANAGRDTRSLQAYLGHKNIQHTVRYTELAPTRFKGWWKD